MHRPRAHETIGRMATLPLFWPDFKSQRFDCQGCTRCCRDLVVHLTEQDRRRIDRRDWAERIGAAPYVRLGRAYVLNHRSDGACVFLTDDGRCRIHAEQSVGDKPLACRMYPFTLDAAGGALRTSIRFDCPSVARNRGEDVARHRREVETLADRWQAIDPTATAGANVAVRLTEGRALDEAELASLLGHLDRWIRDRSTPVAERLSATITLIDTLSGAKLADIDAERFDELVGMLIDELPQVVRDQRQAPPADPTARQQRLLRLAVFAHSEHVGFDEAVAPLGARIRGRLDQLRRGRRMAAGRGSMPSLAGRGCSRTFDDLSHVAPDEAVDPAACDELITRYVRQRIATRAGFGAAYYGWPVLDGLGAVILSVSVAGWLARYLALSDGRSAFGFDDVADAVSIVDRNAGRAPALGKMAARMWLRYLSRDDGLRRLLMCYRLV